LKECILRGSDRKISSPPRAWEEYWFFSPQVTNKIYTYFIIQIFSQIETNPI